MLETCWICFIVRVGGIRHRIMNDSQACTCIRRIHRVGVCHIITHYMPIVLMLLLSYMSLQRHRTYVNADHSTKPNTHSNVPWTCRFSIRQLTRKSTLAAVTSFNSDVQDAVGCCLPHESSRSEYTVKTLCSTSKLCQPAELEA